MPEPTTTLKRFTVSLDADDYEALCTLAHEQRPPISLQYTVRLAIRRLLDECESHTITLVPTSPPARQNNR